MSDVVPMPMVLPVFQGEGQSFTLSEITRNYGYTRNVFTRSAATSKGSKTQRVMEQQVKFQVTERIWNEAKTSQGFTRSLLAENLRTYCLPETLAVVTSRGEIAKRPQNVLSFAAAEMDERRQRNAEVMRRPNTQLSNWYGIPKEAFRSDEERQALLEFLTVQRKASFMASGYGHRGAAPPEGPPLDLYRISAKGTIFVPRFLGASLFGAAERITPEWANIKPLEVEMDLERFDYHKELPQREACEEFAKIIDPVRGGGGVLVVPCGFGKTYCAFRIAYNRRARFIIACNASQIMEQWVEKAHLYWPGCKVGVIKGNNKKIETRGFDVLVVSIQTLVSDSFKLEKGMFEDYEMLVVDECHHLAADSFHRIMLTCSRKVILGLSATPLRQDRFEFLGYWLMGPVFFMYESTKPPTHTEVVKIYTGRRFATKFLRGSDRNVDYNTIFLNMAHDTKRNSILLEALKRLFTTGAILPDGEDYAPEHPPNKRERVAIEFEHVTHIEIFERLLQQEQAKNNFPAHLRVYRFTGEQKPGELREAVQHADIFLATNDKCKEGVDIPNLTTMIMATSITDVEQDCGRATRMHFTKYVCRIVVLRDECDAVDKRSDNQDLFFREHGYVVLTPLVANVEGGDSDGHHHHHHHHRPRGKYKSRSRQTPREHPASLFQVAKVSFRRANGGASSLSSSSSSLAANAVMTTSTANVPRCLFGELGVDVAPTIAVSVPRCLFDEFSSQPTHEANKIDVTAPPPPSSSSLATAGTRDTWQRTSSERFAQPVQQQTPEWGKTGRSDSLRNGPVVKTLSTASPMTTQSFQSAPYRDGMSGYAGSKGYNKQQTDLRTLFRVPAATTTTTATAAAGPLRKSENGVSSQPTLKR